MVYSKPDFLSDAIPKPQPLLEPEPRSPETHPNRADSTQDTRMRRSHMNKVMSLAEAVQEFVRDGASVGLGGQNIGRCAMAAVHEIIRQGKRNLTLYGCNLSISMDMLVGAGLVRRCESGSGNLERFGTTFCWRRKVESGELEVEELSHLAMVSRFLAGEMGLPFMPTKSLLGSDILTYTARGGREEIEMIDNPWNPGE